MMTYTMMLKIAGSVPNANTVQNASKPVQQMPDKVDNSLKRPTTIPTSNVKTALPPVHPIAMAGGTRGNRSNGFDSYNQGNNAQQGLGRGGFNPDPFRPKTYSSFGEGSSWDPRTWNQGVPSNMADAMAAYRLKHDEVTRAKAKENKKIVLPEETEKRPAPTPPSWLGTAWNWVDKNILN